MSLRTDDLFRDMPDADHPVQWLPASGERRKYIPLDEAVRRLEGYGYTNVAALLAGGRQLRTQFAFYLLAKVAGADPGIVATGSLAGAVHPPTGETP